jgi:cellulose synthase/poly-beta-1,6-N-acetylglucosamine synthase-like glycosyltransferase
VLAVGGYVSDTLAEDMDLTWRLRRAGGRLVTENTAIAYTEAPDTFPGFFGQRFRWAFGTLQCLWKHRGALGRHGWFGRLALPALWLFQVLFQALAPLVDLQIAYSLWTFLSLWISRGALRHDWQPAPAATQSLLIVAFYYALFFAVELVGATVAFQLDGERKSPLWWLFWQRFVYRQMMYGVVWKALLNAANGARRGWGKLERKGTVNLAEQQNALS